MSKFLDLIDKSVLVGDGAMGTLLVQELGPVRCVEEANLKNPEVVLGIHLKYIAAGARLIETNTFTANPGRLREVGLEDEVYEINSRAVKLAREARDISAQDVIIAGAIGPVGPAFDLLSPAGREEARRHHCRQVEILEQRGVEVFIAETMPSPRSLRLAVEAIRSVSSLPIIGQLTFPGEQFSDLDVTGVREAFEEVADLPVAVLGVNCGMGPRETLRILEQIPYRTHFRWSVFPNAGIPVRVAGRYMYPDSSPQYFGAWAAEAVRLGARIVGGCCGTRPEQIRAIAGALEGATPVTTAPAVVVSAAREAPSTAAAATTSAFSKKLADGRFVVSIQIDPPKSTETDRLLEAVRTFKTSGLVDAVDVNSNPLARLHMDSLWMSVQVERLGMESIPHITPRDASVMGLQANLLGAHSLGIRNLLVITGDPSQVGGSAGSDDVYQTDAPGLVKLISEMNRGRDANQNLIGNPTEFCVGVAVNPTAPDPALEIRRFHQKIENGARFAMTQVFFDWEVWDRFLAELRDPPPIPVLAAVWPLTSFRLALRLHHEVPGIHVPEGVLQRLEQASKDARKVGFEMAREMLCRARERVQGVYIIAPFKDPLAAMDLFN